MLGRGVIQGAGEAVHFGGWIRWRRCPSPLVLTPHLLGVEHGLRPFTDEGAEGFTRGFFVDRIIPAECFLDRRFCRVTVGQIAARRRVLDEWRGSQSASSLMVAVPAS